MADDIENIVADTEDQLGGWDAGVDLSGFNWEEFAVGDTGLNLTFSELENMHRQGTLKDYISDQWDIPATAGQIEDYFTSLDYSQLNQYRDAYEDYVASTTKQLGEDFRTGTADIRDKYSSVFRDIGKMQAQTGLETSGRARTAGKTADQMIGRAYTTQIGDITDKFTEDMHKGKFNYAANIAAEQSGLVSNFNRQGLAAKTAYDESRRSSGGKK